MRGNWRADPTVAGLRHRVTIRDRVVARDSFGGAGVTYADRQFVWASVSAVTGGEEWLAGHVQAGLTHAVTIRTGPAVGPTVQLGFAGRALNVVAVLPDFRMPGRTLLLCKEEAA